MGRAGRAAVAVHWWACIISGCGDDSKASESHIFLWRARRHRIAFLDLGAPEIGEREVGAEQRPRGNAKIVVVEGCIAVGAIV